MITFYVHTVYLFLSAFNTCALLCIHLSLLGSLKRKSKASGESPSILQLIRPPAAQNASTRSSSNLELPFHDFLENVLSTGLDHISVARYNPVPIPSKNFLGALCEPRAIARARNMPYESLLPRCVSLGVLKAGEYLCQDARCGVQPCFRILLVCRQIEHHVRLDQGLVRLVAENQLLVRMAAHVLIVELVVKLWVNLHALLVLLCPNPFELGPIFSFRVFFAFLRQAVDTHQLGRRESIGPLGEEDMMLEVEGCKVFDIAAKRLDSTFDLWSEGSGREDCESA